ncbi:MAG: type II toxin-antitoxin system ParD family antitoxin [Rhodocyclaceae bacterium]
MPTRNVVLTPHQAQFVEQLVSSGRYQNASEVLREGLRLIERREIEEDLRLAALKQVVDVGIADIERGAFTTFNSAEAFSQHLAGIAAEVIGR